MISIKGIHKFFNKGRQNEIHVIDDITLDIPGKGMVAIFGKSGCGKTTLLNVIGGLDKFSDGSLTVDGKSVKSAPDEIRNQYMGYIFQNYNLNKGETCFENVADALRLCGMTDEKEIEARVMCALKNVGMDKYSRRTPDTLSGGQQQRIAIARAIVKNPRIILADEPTGNLDEANTVMIMDLLKAISKDHLVLLVTHEANLVDFYCDKVIELSDGRVVNVKENESANGYSARDKNDIYLGELSRTEISDANAKIEYYGEAPDTPIEIKIVNNGGRLYLQLGSDKVQILDRFSEVRLREGVYEQREQERENVQSVDMSSLPPVEGKRFGRLFSLKSSIKSGYVSNFKQNKKGKRVLRRCMSLFATVIVFMTAVFGSSFGDMIEARASYNDKMFYVYTPNGEVSSMLVSAVNDGRSGIDFVRIDGMYPNTSTTVTFRAGSFETFGKSDYEGALETNATYLDMSVAKNMRLLEGKRDNLANEEILISSKVADALIEKSILGYIVAYDDLIGLVSSSITIDQRSLRIAGIVESDEPAIYLSELAMAKYVRQRSAYSRAVLASEYGKSVKKGEVVLAVKNIAEDVVLPELGDTVKIQGIDFKIAELKAVSYDYYLWLEQNGIKKLWEYEYFVEQIKKENPSLTEGTEEFNIAWQKAQNEGYFEYLDNYLYSHMDAFFEDLYFFNADNLDFWLYVEKGVEQVKYFYSSSDLYKANEYKRLNGKYPTYNEFYNEGVCSQFPEVYDVVEKQRLLYEQEFYSGNAMNKYLDDITYLVSDEDFIALSKQIGETHKTAIKEQYYFDYGGGMYYPDSMGGYYGDEIYVSPEGQDYCYIAVHSASPEKTEAWLNEKASAIPDPQSEDMYKIMSPDTVFDIIMKDKSEEIIAGFIAIAVIIGLMSLCMYFIMRSSLMNRIKEIGIYRAIGVSKKNLVFKFFIEAIVLTTLTVFVGYLITSGFMMVCFSISALVAQTFYYPLWLALCVLGVLYIISLFFGTLPIISLLRKTPSQILSKYDI